MSDSDYKGLTTLFTIKDYKIHIIRARIHIFAVTKK